ncbi:MAG: NACHT domain-containing protein [Verrucomicrobiota bacterium]
MKPTKGLQKKFPQETALRAALIGLLAKMPDVSDVQELHGTNEKGRDIVFKTVGPFGESVNCACVVKNHDIHTKTGKPDGIFGVLNQARACLKNPFPDAGGQMAQIQRVYVITSGQISPVARETISAELREFGGQVQFIGGEELLRLFQTHWPDFLADEATVIYRYVSQLEKRLSNPSEMETLTLHFPELTKLGSARPHYVSTDFILSLYWIDCSLFIAVTDIGRLPQNVSSEEVKSLVAELHAVQRYLEHLHEWGFLKPHELRHLAALVQRFETTLGEEWSHGKASGDGIGTNLQDIGKRQFRCRDVVMVAQNQLTQGLKSGNQMIAGYVELGKAIDLRGGLQLTSSLDPTLLNHHSAVACLLAHSGAGFKKSISTRQMVLSANEIRSFSGITYVTAPAGYGKTSFCRWSALEDLRTWKKGKGSHLPLYLQLGTIDAISVRSIDRLLQLATESGLLSETEWRSVNEGRMPLRLYLDGLDEVPFKEQRADLMECARLLAVRHPDAQVVITARDYLLEPWVRGIRRLDLAGFARSHVQELAAKLLSDEKNAAEQFIHQVDSSKALTELSRVPLLATLMLLIFRQSGDLPGKRTALYNTFIDLMCGSWDAIRRIQRHSAFGREAKLAILGRLAFMAHSARKRRIPISMFREACTNAAPGMFGGALGHEREARMSALLGEMLVDGLLQQFQDAIEFSHLSFQEFLMAKELSHTSFSEEAKNVISMYLQGDDWFEEVVHFFVCSSADPEKMADWIVEFSQIKGSVEARNRIARIHQEIRTAFPTLCVGR